MIIGLKLLTPHTFITNYIRRCLAVYKVAKLWHEQVDNKYRHVEFNVGDFILVMLLLSQHKSTRSLHKGFVQQYEGPFPVINRVDNVSYKLELPSWFKLHLVFHVSYLKP